MTVGTSGCARFCYASLILKQLIFIYFSWKWIALDQTYSFENRKILIITKNADTLLYSSLSWNSEQIFKANGLAVLVLALEEHDKLWFFASSSPLKLSWHSSFNSARSACSFYWCYIFVLNIRDLKISTQKEKHVIL